jgi:hypothetical protein
MIQFAIYVTLENLHRFGGVTTKTCTFHAETTVIIQSV